MGTFNRGGRDNDRRGGGGFRGRDSGRGGGFNRGGGDRQMHQAVCSACKKNCEIPFKPRNDKPVFCSDCFSKQGGGDRGPRPNKFGGDRGSGGSNQEVLKEIKALSYKLDELIRTLAPKASTSKTAEYPNVKTAGPERSRREKTAGPERSRGNSKPGSKAKIAKKKASKKKAAAPKKAAKKKTVKKKK